MAAVELTRGMRILFQGDSITDAGRGVTEHGLGQGYAAIAAGLVSAAHAELGLEFLNRGVSGNRAADLERRWTADCIELRPDLVSILIGINDTWRRYDSNDPTGPGGFESVYRRVLERTRDELGAKIVILEPFLLPCPADRASWREDLDPKIAVVRRVAAEFADVFVPLDGIFAAASVAAGPAYWAPDGVHLTQAGHGLIATEWVKAVTGRPPLK